MPALQRSVPADGVPARTGPPRARAPLLALLRPSHWVKNAFVLAPLLFSGTFDDAEAVGRSLYAALLFCAASSLVYVVNDLRDVAFDRLHPVKRLSRPIASGAVAGSTARAVAGALLVVVLLGVVAAPWIGAGLLGYVLLNLAYSYGLKRLFLVDLLCVGAGFVLRVWTGAVAAEVPLSWMMLVTTLSLALYLAAVKRRQELNATLRGGGRAVLGAYSPALLDRFARGAAFAAIACYALWVVMLRADLAITLPLVLFGFARYGYLVRARDLGECPTDALWRDPPLLLTVIAWCATSFWAMLP